MPHAIFVHARAAMWEYAENKNVLISSHDYHDVITPDTYTYTHTQPDACAELDSNSIINSVIAVCMAA